MATEHDNLPHPVPPLAYLRWKENYFFIVNDPTNQVFGACHLNFEPGFDRARFSFNLSVRGTLHKYGNETSFPIDFAYSTVLSDGVLTLQINEKLSQFTLSLSDKNLVSELCFTPRMAAFDFGTCKYAAPDLPSYQDVMTLGYNLPFEHMQQAMNVNGTLMFKDSGERIAVDCTGYRDHSWCVRSDNLVLNHTFSGHNFPGFSIGVMTLEIKTRPGLVSKEGYVVDSEGARAFNEIEVLPIKRGGEEEIIQVQYNLRDVYGKKYRLVSNIEQRWAHVPLVAEKAVGDPVYRVDENFCETSLHGIDERGYSIVELGQSI